MRIMRRSSIASKSPRQGSLVRSIRRAALAGTGAEAADAGEADDADDAGVTATGG
jgi:hypothetical protein